MQAGSADRDGSAASTSEARKRNHYARPGQVSFDERRYKLATLAVESFGCLRKVAASIVGGTDVSSLSWKGRLQGTPLPDYVYDNPGRDFAPSD